MRKTTPLLLALALASPIAALAAPSLLTNGSFEDGPALGMGSWTIAASIPGWQGDPASGGGIELRRNAAGTAQDGSYFVELDTYRNSWMTQAVATSAGAHYTLSWYYSPRAGVGAASNAIEVYWNGLLLDVNSGSGIGQADHQWQLFSADVVGSGGLDVLRFAAAGASDSYGGSLDHIALVRADVPEPATLVLAVAALGLLGAGRRRRGG